MEATVDNRISTGNVCDRVCAVKISSGWWPALKFSSHADLITTLNSDFANNDTSINLNRLKGKVTIRWNRMKAAAKIGDNESLGLAYLMGKDSQIMLLPESQPDLVGDFHIEYDDMTKGSKELRAAAELLLNRVDLEIQSSFEADAAEGGVAAVGGKKFDSVEEAKPLVCLDVKPETVEKKKTAKNKGAGRKKKVPAKKENKMESDVEDEECAEQRSDHSVKEVVKDYSKDPISPLKFSEDGDSLSIENSSRVGVPRHIPLADKNASWHDFFQSMKESGWTHCNGDGLVSYYWIHPLSAHLKKKDLLAQKTCGEDYFVCEEAVKRYAKYNYGWLGEVDSPANNMPGPDLIDGIKKSTRTSKVVRRSVAPEKVAVSEKKKQPRSLSKKVAVSEQHSLSSTSELSRFSFQPGLKRKIAKNLNVHSNTPETKSTSACSDFSASIDTSVDPTYQVMKSCDAWELLMKLFGFTYDKKKYCLPGKENKPSSNEGAQEGVHYFSTIEDLRKNLCAFGLPESKKALSPQEKIDICRWVRYTYVNGIADGAKINEDYIGDPITQRVAWSWLQRLGLKYSSGNYVVPESATGKTKKFVRAEDLYAHLAQFGIPRYDVKPGPPLSDDQRLQLDLFICNPGKHLDTFKRIYPENNELTPLRPSRNRPRLIPNTSPRMASHTRKQIEVVSKPKKTQPSKFEQEFKKLQKQRDLPINIISSRDAIDLLQKHYDISHIENPESSLYCFTDTHSNQEVQFYHVQELRENLCAFGLPSIVEGSKISKKQQLDLEFWVRFAHMEQRHDEPTEVAALDQLNYQEAKALIKKLGYKISKDMSIYVLPGADFHNPIHGKDGWDNLLDFFNHIARFGLLESSTSSVSNEEILRLKMFITCVTTFDISVRLQYNASAKQASSETYAHSSAVPEQTLSDKFQNQEQNALLTQPAMIDDEDSSPTKEPTPKKPKATGLLGYFTKKVTNMFSPTRSNSLASSSQDNGAEHDSPALTPSCLEKGDDSVERCFEDSFSFSKRSCDNTLSFDRAHSQEDAVVKTSTDAPSQVKSSPSKRKAEEITSNDSTREAIGLEATGSNTENNNRNIIRLSQARDPTMTWTEMEMQMKDDGMWYLPGTGLESFWWVHPTFQGLKKNELMQQCKEGEDYFRNEESLKLYAKKHLGWAGVIASEEKRRRKEPLKVKSPPKRAAPEAVKSSPKKARRSPEPKTDKNVASPKTSNSSFDGNDGVESVCMPDEETIIGDKLHAAQMALHPSFYGNYCSVSAKASSIMEFMATCVVEGDESAPRSGFLYVCGRPGTGKTTVVQQCTEDTKSWAKAEGYSVPLISSVNMSSLFASASAKDGIMKEMLKKSAKHLGIHNEPNIHSLEKQARKNVIILVIDEIDMLIKRQISDGERFFCELIRLTKEENLSFSLIGISNSVNDEYSERIKEIGAPQEVVFPSYDENGLREIIEKRIGKNVVDAKAIELVSRKIAASSGDARKVLEITSNAIQICMDSLSDDLLSKEIGPDDGPSVKITHMMRAIRDGNVIKHAEVIQKLPQLAKVVLCIAVAYGHVMGPNADISPVYLKKLCAQATKYALFDDSDIASILGLIETICDSGLLRIKNNGVFETHDPNMKLTIDVQLDDLECALGESLLNGENGAFYSKLMDFVKIRHRHCYC